MLRSIATVTTIIACSFATNAMAQQQVIGRPSSISYYSVGSSQVMFTSVFSSTGTRSDCHTADPNAYWVSYSAQTGQWHATLAMAVATGARVRVTGATTCTYGVQNVLQVDLYDN
jgi:hypothetical protein